MSSTSSVVAGTDKPLERLVARMSPRISRRAVVASVIGVFAVVGAASLAWACTSFTTINLSVSSGAPGTEIMVRGENAAPNSNVVLRWDSRTAPRVATIATDGAGKFAVPVKAPDAIAGVHVLLATDGQGAIARGAFEIPAGAGSTTDLTAHTAAAPAQPTDWLRLGANLLGIGLAGAVAVLGLAVLRRRPVPVTLRNLPSEG